VKGPGYLEAKSGIMQHCEALVANYRRAAKKLEAMAEMHRGLAAAAP
jgi:hypothetical protein